MRFLVCFFFFFMKRVCDFSQLNRANRDADGRNSLFGGNEV